MITGRIYKMDNRKIADIYLGNEVGRPIAIASFDTMAVNFMENRFMLIISKGEDKSLFQCDRLYIENDEGFKDVIEFADICATPKVKERIRVLTLQVDKPEDARYGHIRR